MIAQTLETVSEDSGSGRFSAEQIKAMILKHKIKATSQFTAQQIAVRCLEASQRRFVHRYVNPRTASRRHQRGHSYGDCHWGGK